jgi:hypothetical protein
MSEGVGCASPSGNAEPEAGARAGQGEDRGGDEGNSTFARDLPGNR